MAALVLPLTVLVSPPVVAQGPPPSSAEPDGDLPTSSQTQTVGPASVDPCAAADSILILQDVTPWDSHPDQDPRGANVTELALHRNDFCVRGAAALDAISLGQFATIIISSAQTQQFYDTLFPAGAIHPELETWVASGGTLLAQLADHATGPGQFGVWGDSTFLGGVTADRQFTDDNTIVDADHPIVKGRELCPSGNCTALWDLDARIDIDGWNSSSHGVFTNLPSTANTILSDATDGRPVLVEYPHGDGQVVATTTTPEWRYVGGIDQYYDLSQNLTANLIAYAIGTQGPLRLSPGHANLVSLPEQWAQVTAHLVDPDTGAPAAGSEVTFSIDAGSVNAGVDGYCLQDGLEGERKSDTCVTDEDGKATWGYQYAHPPSLYLGDDTVTVESSGVPSDSATITWLRYASYAALGDSYSSGTGAGDDFGTPPGFEDYPEDCRRVPNAYPAKVTFPGYTKPAYHTWQETFGLVGWDFAACHGAFTRHVKDTRQHGEPPQIDLVGSSTNVTTITIGGNDAAFTPVAFFCGWHDSELDCADPDVVFRDGKNVDQWVRDKIREITPRLVDIYTDIRVDNEDQPVFVLGYPHPFPDTAAEQGCVNLFRFSTAEQNMFRELTDLLNDAVAAAATQAGVHHVDPRPHFDGHEACGEKGQWISGFSFLDSHGSFHPTERGQKAYAFVLERYIDRQVAEGAPTEPTGLPSNPAPAAAATAAATAATASSEFGYLSVAPAEARDPDVCGRTYQPGSQVHVRGEGFSPSVPVEITADAGDGNAIPLTTVTSDADGRIDATVTLPSSLPGTADATVIEDFVTKGVILTLLAEGPHPAGVDNVLVAGVGVADQVIRCDITSPTITLNSPTDGGQYSIGELVTADYSCAGEPDGAGLAYCEGDTPSGGQLDTSRPGTYSFSVSATDSHGNGAYRSVTYEVVVGAGATIDAPSNFWAGCDDISGWDWGPHCVARTGWDAVPDAALYKVYRQEVGADGNPTSDPVVVWQGTETSATVRGGASNAVYDYWVVAVDTAEAESGPSNVVQVVFDCEDGVSTSQAPPPRGRP